MKIELPSLLKLYKQLIAIPSISSNDVTLDQSNEIIIDLLAEWFETIGFSINKKAIPNTRNKFNMIAKIGDGDGGLLLVGHTDTVPYNEKWTNDPFRLKEANNKLYGLGTADMKGFFAFILHSLREIKIKKLNKPLYILATADEETNMAGAKYFSQSTEILPNFAIIGEPTALKPVRMHKGHMSYIIHIQGTSGHSSYPTRGINAIELMYEIITQLIKLRDELKEKYNNNYFDIPYSTMNFGCINGGDTVNRICSSCELHIDIRTIPGLTVNYFHNLLSKALDPVNIRWPKRLSIKEIHPPIPSYECSSTEMLVKTIENLLGLSSESVNYCTEASFIQQLCPTLILGPGDINQAHQPDEYMDTLYIKPTCRLFKKLIYSICCK